MIVQHYVCKNLTTTTRRMIFFVNKIKDIQNRVIRGIFVAVIGYWLSFKIIYARCLMIYWI